MDPKEPKPAETPIVIYDRRVQREDLTPEELVKIARKRAAKAARKNYGDDKEG